MTPEDIQTTISIITGVINLVLLTFLINFFKTYREIAKEREDLIKEQKNLSDSRTQVAKDELAFTDRQNKQLIVEKDILQKQLTDILKSKGIERSFLFDANLVKNLTDDFIQRVNTVTSRLEKIEKVADQSGRPEINDGYYHLSLGNGHLVSKEWAKAITHLDIASLTFPTDSNIHFTRGVCYANIKGGIAADRKSVEAYSQAIIYLPEDEKETRNKAYIYRGAMFKRLRKLDEAEGDLTFGLSHTTIKHFKADALYNLACVYAMRSDKESLIQTTQMLKKLDIKYLAAIKSHFSDYFVNFVDDIEFRTLLR